jgi:PleD family two-component response regulator
MILAVLDDLMFTSKIRTAASGVGVPVTFARSREAALIIVREQRPALVVLDLNSERTDPLGLVAAMKVDQELRNIDTIGFVSHVDAPRIEAARAAGVGEVLARSAFAQRLPQLLERGR